MKIKFFCCEFTTDTHIIKLLMQESSSKIILRKNPILESLESSNDENQENAPMDLT